MKTHGPRVPEAQLVGITRTSLDSPNPTAEQLARKQRSFAIVQELNLPWLATLPVIEEEASLTARTTAEVSERCLANTVAAIKGETNDQSFVDDLKQRYCVRSLFSLEELAFIENPQPTRRELSKFSWRYECMHVFLWALSYVPRLNPPHQQSIVQDEVGAILGQSLHGFMTNGTLRPLADLLDQADLYYRLHWATVELGLKRQASPVAHPGIVLERHRALNWLIRYMNQAWDDVQTDT